jgi:hypothetical protein
LRNASFFFINCSFAPRFLFLFPSFINTSPRERRRRRRRRARRFEEKVLTRALKRRMGLRDLWDVIVNNDDISFKHILPRLNRTDIKLLYDVNSETRALIKRSSRKDELKMKFEVSEMSSISTLEFAWKNMHWLTAHRLGWENDESWFCWKVAGTNKLELLKWALEEKKFDWDENIIYAAVGNLEMLKYCVANECPVRDSDACSSAASIGHLECLKYLHETAKAPWDSETADEAAYKGHLHILEYLVERKFDEYDTRACNSAASQGHLDCLKFLHEVAKAPWHSCAVRYAHEYNHPECLQYLLDNGCPLPKGWRYEDGELHVPKGFVHSDSESE